VSEDDDDIAVEAPHPRETFALFGHSEAEQALLAAYRGGRIPHAWLIGGPVGIGKATVAYRMARFVLAHPDPAAADVQTARSLAVAANHPVARHIASQAHPDLLVFERIIGESGKLNKEIKVEQIRRSVAFFGSTAGEGGWRVAIVDAVEELNPAGENALLKVLEEPPANVVFVLVARSPEALVGTVPSRARTVPFVSLSLAELTAALAAELDLSPEQAAWAAAAGHGRLARARALLTDEATRTRRSSVLDLLGQLGSDQSSDALAAAGTVAALADEVVAAARLRQEGELAELDEAFGTGRGTGALRRRLEVRHRRELRRARFDAIREALADLLGAYRDVALLGASGAQSGRAGAPLVHPDKAATTERLAARVDPAAAVRAADALEEADRRLTIGAAPQLTLEAAFLSVQAALRGPSVPIRRLAIRR
jgi:DNA polymerase III subunit delta'